MPGLSLLDPSSLRSKAAALNQVSTVLRGSQGAGGLGYFLLRLRVLKPGARPLAGHPGDGHVGAPWSGVKEAEEAPRAAAPGLGLENGAVVLRTLGQSLAVLRASLAASSSLEPESAWALL